MSRRILSCLACLLPLAAATARPAPYELAGNQLREEPKPYDHPSQGEAFQNWAAPREEIPAPPQGTWQRKLSEADIKDTYIRNEGAYTNDNFGTDPFLIVGERPSAGSRRILLQFPGRIIEEAVAARKKAGKGRIVLQLFKHASSYAERVIPVVVQPLRTEDSLGGWIEGNSGLDRYLDGVSWGPNEDGRFDPPAYDPQYAWKAELGAPKGQWAELDLTEIFLAWNRGKLPNHGLLVRMQDESTETGLGDHLYASTSYGNPDGHPRLAVRRER